MSVCNNTLVWPSEHSCSIHSRTHAHSPWLYIAMDRTWPFHIYKFLPLVWHTLSQSWSRIRSCHINRNFIEISNVRSTSFIRKYIGSRVLYLGHLLSPYWKMTDASLRGPKRPQECLLRLIKSDESGIFVIRISYKTPANKTVGILSKSWHQLLWPTYSDPFFYAFSKVRVCLFQKNSDILFAGLFYEHSIFFTEIYFFPRQQICHSLLCLVLQQGIQFRTSHTHISRTLPRSFTRNQQQQTKWTYISNHFS